MWNWIPWILDLLYQEIILCDLTKFILWKLENYPKYFINKWLWRIGRWTLNIGYGTLDTLTKLSNKLFCYANFINKYCVYSLNRTRETSCQMYFWNWARSSASAPLYFRVLAIFGGKHFHFNVIVYCLQNFAYKIDIDIIALMMVELFKPIIRRNFQEIQQQWYPKWDGWPLTIYLCIVHCA